MLEQQPDSPQIASAERCQPHPIMAVTFSLSHLTLFLSIFESKRQITWNNLSHQKTKQNKTLGYIPAPSQADTTALSESSYSAA